MEEIAKALIAFQSSCPSVSFDKENPHFHSRFASLKNILKTIEPALRENGLSVMQFPHSENFDGRVCVGCRTIVRHESGKSIEHCFVFPLSKQDPQAAMAALTYARRGALGAALGLVIEEDDENGSALGVGALKDAGKKAPREQAPAGMSKPHREKLKNAAADRLMELGDTKADIPELLDVVAINLGYSSHIELKDSEFDAVMTELKTETPVPF